VDCDLPLAVAVTFNVYVPAGVDGTGGGVELEPLPPAHPPITIAPQIASKSKHPATPSRTVRICLPKFRTPPSSIPAIINAKTAIGHVRIVHGPCTRGRSCPIGTTIALPAVITVTLNVPGVAGVTITVPSEGLQFASAGAPEHTTLTLT
jgi:hypothetical protein